MGSETLRFEVGAGDEQVVEELADEVIVVIVSELVDGDGESDAVKVRLGG